MPLPSFNILDGCFPRGKSAVLGGENQGEGPAHFEWDWDCQQTSGPVFFTDMCLSQAAEERWRGRRKVAWLIEPPAIHTAHYDYAWEHQDLFDHILCQWRKYTDLGGRYLFYPLGGSRIKDWGVFPKMKLVSLIASAKTAAVGHRLRHEAIAMIREAGLPCGPGLGPQGLPVDIYGLGYNPVKSKAEALRDYMYSVTVQNCDVDCHFTEWLIDPLSQGTVPLFWGSRAVAEFFDAEGILFWHSLDELRDLLQRLTPQDYAGRQESVRCNLAEARKYRCPEDWIWEHYPFLFQEV